jgi:hypothetical protein
MYTVESITDIVYRTEDKKHINCKVKFAEFDEVHPFTASDTDPEDHGVSIYNDIVSGKYGPIGDYVPPLPPTTEQLWRRVRDRRDTLLTQSDILVLPDRWNSYTEQKQNALSAYRQALRDITTQSDPSNIDWPTIPN